MTELVINWNPMVHRDFDSFRKIVLETEDRALRERALLKVGGVIDALMGEIIRAGYLMDVDTIAYAGHKYRQACADGLELELRKRLFQEVTAFTQNYDDCAAATYLPFVFEEEDCGIVSTAALDYVSVGKIADGADPMLLPRHLIRMLENREVKNSGAVFGGLLNTGDPRVCELLWDARSILNEDEINQACLCHSGFMGAATVDFYLRWLEEIVHLDRESLVGKLASGLALIRRKLQTDSVFTEMRPFPYRSFDGEDLRACLKPVPLDDYTRDIAPRMLKLTAEEQEPRVMPEVLNIWGICNLPDAKGILIIDDLAERCWEVFSDENLSPDEWYGSLARLVDIGFGLGSEIIYKVAVEINRRGKPQFWQIVLDRFEMFLEFQQHETADGTSFGQIVAMPIICSTVIPDEQLSELFARMPPLPTGEIFKFVPTALRWGELHGNERINRLLHAMLYRWISGDGSTAIQIERDIASLPSLNDRQAPLDDVIVTDALTLKLRFLVGYKMVGDSKDQATTEQRDAWVTETQALLGQREVPGEVFVRYPTFLRSALYAGQAAMMYYVLYSVLKYTEETHSTREAERFGIRIECFGDTFTQLAQWFTVTSYDLQTGETIAHRDIPIALPSATSRWAAELEEMRVRAERLGCPYVITAPILQPSQMHWAVFAKTKCIKITLGAPMQFDTEYTDTLSLDPRSHLQNEKARWDIERKVLPSDVELLRSSFAQALGIKTEELQALETFSLEGDRWLPTVMLLFEGVKCIDGTEVAWPPEKEAIEMGTVFASTFAGRKWARYYVGGVPLEEQTRAKSVEETLDEARGGNVDAQILMAEMLYEGTRVPVDLETSLQWYRKAALNGHAGAQAMVGYMLENGEGCEKSEAEAFHWFRLGAENGDAYCQFKFAEALEEGLQTPKNASEALDWYRKAAEQEYASAQFALGWKLYSGETVAEDLVAAADLFEKAALQGQAAAQYNLGAMLAHGEHSEVDMITACAWLRLAAEQDYDGAEDGLISVIKKMSTAELEEAKALAQQLKQKISG